MPGTNPRYHEPEQDVVNAWALGEIGRTISSCTLSYNSWRVAVTMGLYRFPIFRAEEPGTQAGTYRRIGKYSTKKRPGTLLMELPSVAFCDSWTYLSLESRMRTPYMRSTMMATKVLRPQSEHEAVK